MTRTTTMLFLTLAFVVMLGCCDGKTCVSDGANSPPDAGKATSAPIHD